MTDDTTDATTVDIDTTVSDATDLSMLGSGTIGDATVDVAGAPNDAGHLPERVRVRGTLAVTLDDADADPDADGLYGKYDVFEDGERVADCFVLEPADDPAALAALKAYAKTTDGDALAADLAYWIAEIEDETGGDSSE